MFSKKELHLITETPKKKSSEKFIKDIRKNTRRIFTAEQKILIVMEGLRAETSVAELCRQHNIAQSQFYSWNKEFIEATVRTDVVYDENASHFDEGYMTIEQVNLLFRTLPLDLTYVDENDRVIFYNRGEERVFPRSAGIIGREVRFCHPPKSVDTVLKILEEFRKGTQNEASFWFNYRDKLIYVRYFAVRDSEKNYRGVIEMSQDISETKKIEGERRLLEWE